MRGNVVKDARNSFASLSSSLLARKGHARPAMRPNSGQSLEDLGWNDHGNEPETDSVAAEPTPIRYQATISASFSTPEDLIGQPSVELSEDAPEVALSVRPRATARRARPSVKGAKSVAPLGKAAFTLRLDETRHLRLRLACAMLNRSGQQIVAEALEQFLEGVSGLDELAVRLPSQSLKGHN